MSDVLPWGGLVLLVMVMTGAALTGLPVWTILTGVASLGAGIAILTGALDAGVLAVLPGRLVGLLESDILQALPLFAFIGALMNRLPLAALLFRGGVRICGGGATGGAVATLGIGAVLGPMNGSVGANAMALSRAISPRLAAEGLDPPKAVAVIAVASTLGVLVPPSLVLILLADTMMGAHTLALNNTGRAGQVINAQDIFHGALWPAALFLAGAIAVALLISRRNNVRGVSSDGEQVSPRLAMQEWAVVGFTLVFIIILLGGVVTGLFYAVEAAAMGAVGLMLGGWLSRRLDGALLRQVLEDALVITGVLFALLVAATSFTLVFRVFGSDKLIEAWMVAVPGGEPGALLAGLLIIAVSAFALDAFEIIFVIVPLIMPPVLMRVSDAPWVAVLTLMTLQASFLLPPFGYALTMTRAMAARPAALGASIRALLPFFVLQLAMLVAVLAFPALVHPFGAPRPARSLPQLTPDQVNEKFNNLIVPQPQPAFDLPPPRF